MELDAYGRNNPLRFVDDTGQASIDYLRRKAVMLAKEQSPELAGDPDNIQFATREQHFEDLHGRNTRIPTFGA